MGSRPGFSRRAKALLTKARSKRAKVQFARPYPALKRWSITLRASRLKAAAEQTASIYFQSGANSFR